MPTVAVSDEFLEAMIRMNSNPVRDMARGYLEQVMTHLQSQQESVEPEEPAAGLFDDLEPVETPSSSSHAASFTAGANSAFGSNS